MNGIKIIHQVFLDVGLKPFKDRLDYQKNISINKKINPEYEHILWDDDKVNDLITTQPDYIKEIWEDFPEKFYKIDFVRYLILDKYGGIYIDLDVYCIIPLDPNKFIVGQWYDEKISKWKINNNVICIEHSLYHKLIKYAIEQYHIKKNIHVYKTWVKRRFLESVGAYMFRRFIKKHDANNNELIFNKMFIDDGITSSKTGSQSWLIASASKKNDTLTCHQAITSPMDYDFIEIGTSDFATEIQKAKDGMKGISIDMIPELLDRLPDKKNVIKVCWGISDVGADFQQFYVPQEDRVKHGLPKWIDGCGTLERPHPIVSRFLTKRNLLHLIKHRKCEVHTFTDLVEKFHIKSVEYLKIDVEGHDPRVIKSVMESGILPKRIKYEHVHTSTEDRERTIQLLTKNGYEIGRTTRMDQYCNLRSITNDL